MYAKVIYSNEEHTKGTIITREPREDQNRIVNYQIAEFARHAIKHTDSDVMLSDRATCLCSWPFICCNPVIRGSHYCRDGPGCTSIDTRGVLHAELPYTDTREYPFTSRNGRPIFENLPRGSCICGEFDYGSSTMTTIQCILSWVFMSD